MAVTTRFVASQVSECPSCEHSITPGQQVEFRMVHTRCPAPPGLSLVLVCPVCSEVQPCGCEP